MSFRLWEIIKDPDIRAILSLVGGGAVVVAGGIWTVVTIVVEHKDSRKEPTVQIQEALTGQLTAKDAQINELIKQNVALTKSLLEKNPAAGPGAQQAVGAAVGSIAQGAAEGDTRLQQALDLLKANKIADAARLLNAVAEEKTALAEQAMARTGQETAPAEKDRTDAAIARRSRRHRGPPPRACTADWRVQLYARLGSTAERQERSARPQNGAGTIF